MGHLSLVWSKAILAVCNFFLLACGFGLIGGGIMTLFDSDRILLSKLIAPDGVLMTMTQPLLYYIVLGFSSLGLILAATGVLGCWASCLHNYFLLTMYFLIITIVLAGQCTMFAIIWTWPNCLGLSTNTSDLIHALQKYYGAADQDIFTAAVDLMQTMFHCCGIDSANEYDTSLWRLQALSPSLAIPLSCCKLINEQQSKAYLNPVPRNNSLCQALEFSRHREYRHVSGCSIQLQEWYRQHYLIVLAIGIGAALIELIVLLSTVLMCTKIYKFNREVKEASRQLMHAKVQESFRRPTLNAYDNDTYAMSDSFRKTYKLSERM